MEEKSVEKSRALEAVATLYHAWLTGLILTVITRKSHHAAEEFVFRLFRRQHLAMFLPGLKKLGLDEEPAAVAAAKYHYFSNQLGGVKVEYYEESPRKAWIRYPPPRWIWKGTAICAVPSNVNRAMLRGWHAHNGVTMGNLRLGFVCTKTTVDGQPGLEGYYFEYDHDLPEEERLVFISGENAPFIDPESLPKLDADSWPEERRQKANRNYAMEYIRSALPELVALFGPSEARYLGHLSALQIGMQFKDEISQLFNVSGYGPIEFANLYGILAEAQGDDVRMEEHQGGMRIIQKGWRLMRNVPLLHECVFECWNGLWEGLLAAHNPHLKWVVKKRIDQGDPCFEWLITPLKRGTSHS
jgi:hypothetical protein